jgi:hypothetical protein
MALTVADVFLIRRTNRLEGVLQGNTGLPRKPDEELAVIWLVRLALEIVSVLSQMAQSQVRLFIAALPTAKPIFDRQVEEVCAILTMRRQIA